MSGRFLLALALVALPARAADPALRDAQRAQVEEVRGEIADQVQLQAYDLVDELVYQWSQQPLFGAETPLVLADVSVPVGFGSGLQALLENHLAAVLAKTPHTGVVLVHCPQCTAMVVHSGAKGTVVARGVDDPEALAAAGALGQTKHALFLDFEFEGSALVLRARVTALEPKLPIVSSKTLSTTTSSPALLRSPDRLKSAAAARQEYLEVLEGRGLLSVPVHLGVRSYAPNQSVGRVVSAPFYWLELGVEVALSQARAWTASLSLGASWIPQVHIGAIAQARFSRLLTGSTTSLTHPDVYAFLGGSVIFLQGQNAQTFRDTQPNLENLVQGLNGLEPTAVVGALQVGLELRLKNRIGVAVFLESLPAADTFPSIGTYVDVALRFHAIGVEVLFCF